MRYIDWKDGNVVNLANCGTLTAPIAIELLSSQFEAYIETRLKANTKLYIAFSPIITSTREYENTRSDRRHVDLSREDRLEKCNLCFEQFGRLREKVIE